MPRSRQLVHCLLTLGLLAACDGDHGLDPRPHQGQVRISIVMSGIDLDRNGALVTVDGGAPTVVPSNGSVTLSLSPGTHVLLLDGLGGNCLPEGGATRQVQVAEDAMTPAVFSVTCGAAAGVLEVSVTTAGSDLDPDGYLVSVDNGFGQRVLSGSTTRFAPVASGTHTITVRDLAANCAVDGDNPLAGVAVTAGGPIRDTVRVAFAVVCNPRFGTLKLVASTTGPDDPNGYVVTLGTSPPTQYRLGVNDSLVVNHLAGGTYRFGVSDLAGNCSLSGSAPEWVTIVGGATLVVRFEVTCIAPTIFRVSAPTSGPNPDPGYVVVIDGGGTHPLLAWGTLELGLTPGEHAVELTDVAANCVVSGGERAVVNLSTGVTTELIFAVTCSAQARTGLDLTIATTGSDLDPSYFLSICGDLFCDQPVFARVIPATTTLQLDLPAGSYGVDLNDVADNCTKRWTGNVTVTAGAVSTLRIDVTCAGRTSFAATVTATGSDLPEQYRLTVDGRDAGWLRPGETVTVSSWEGEHLIGLGWVQGICRVIGPNPMTVTLHAGVITPVDFAVACEPYAVVHVSTSTSGTNIPAGFVVGVDPDWWYGYTYSTGITPNGSVSFRVYPGRHEVWLDQLPGNCTVDGSNPIVANVPGGSTTELAFAVTCR